MFGEAAWTEDGQPVTFASPVEAETALAEYLEEIAEAVALGDMIAGYDEDDFKIVPVS